MGEHSKIEWCDHTFNPWSGCQKVSPGCQHCYAERQAKRNPRTLGVWGPQGTRVRTSADNWRKPLKWNKDNWIQCHTCQWRGDVRTYLIADGPSALGKFACPMCHSTNITTTRQRVFCASMADVFEDRPELVEWRVDLFRMIVHTRGLDWLLLTKRPQNVVRMLDGMGWPALPDNVWIGTTVENQAAADERIPHLLNVPAAVRFLSCEPLLGAIDLHGLGGQFCHKCGQLGWYDLDGVVCPHCGQNAATTHTKIHWVIAGGESGQNARPMHPGWARSIRDQCRESGVPFFFKQWGEYVPVSSDNPMPLRQVRSLLFMRPGGEILQGEDFIIPGDVALWRAGKKAAGRLLDGVEWNQFPG